MKSIQGCDVREPRPIALCAAPAYGPAAARRRIHDLATPPDRLGGAPYLAPGPAAHEVEPRKAIVHDRASIR